MGLYDNLCVLEPLGPELRTNMSKRTKNCISYVSLFAVYVFCGLN
jgi:hypothetical protein